MRQEGADLRWTRVSVVTSLVLSSPSQKERRTDKGVPLSVAEISLFGSDLITLAKQPGVRSNRCCRRRADEWRNKKQLVIHVAPNSRPNNTSRGSSRWLRLLSLLLLTVVELSLWWPRQLVVKTKLPRRSCQFRFIWYWCWC